ncbi:hypothetical protein Ae201684_015197 [Aphanomyces euteiches]|uniref:Bromo domain-containing protein n=1 Tax=Aphanomyces euteiches TaxID=100861 RepID=A0A6G0WHB1_9STRA|nr:hypothetical protein Ae201684_015197 [Aphanomyces euteiches]KAH9133585.1 hypothetical protein AeRB84_020366 [Aphanomyces euteiches]
MSCGRAKVHDEDLKESMTRLLRTLVKKDAYELFYRPVDTREVPDYLEKIEKPMSFSIIEKNITRQAYHSLDDFKSDILTVFSNAQQYNMENTIYFREATKLASLARELFHDTQEPTRSRPLEQSHNATIDRQLNEETEGPDTQLEMDLPKFDLGIRLPVVETNAYLADTEDDEDIEDFEDVCSQDLDGYHTDSSYVFDDIIHAPLPDSPLVIAKPSVAVDAVADIDSDSSLSDGIDYEVSVPPPRPQVVEHRRPLCDKENRPDVTDKGMEWISTKRRAPSGATSSIDVTSPPVKKAYVPRPYKSIFGEKGPPRAKRQALMDLYVNSGRQNDA